MTMGAEPKKVVALVSLVAVAAIVYWMNSSSDAPAPVAVTRPAVEGATPPAAGPVGGPKAIARREARGKPGSVGDFTFKQFNGQDTSKVDPTIRFDLLAKVQAVGVEGGKRNIFQPASDPELVKQREVEQAKLNEIKKIHPDQPAVLAKDPVATAPPPPPGPPPVPPINLKYYGYSTKRSDGEKKAFFLDGEDIIVASEGDVIKKQYKVVRIGVNSVQMEDTHSKSSQTLPLQADAAPV